MNQTTAQPSTPRIPSTESTVKISRDPMAESDVIDISVILDPDPLSHVSLGDDVIVRLDPDTYLVIDLRPEPFDHAAIRDRIRERERWLEEEREHQRQQRLYEELVRNCKVSRPNCGACSCPGMRQTRCSAGRAELLSRQ